MIYVGDGTNDFCPVLHLRRLGTSSRDPYEFNKFLGSQDKVLCRVHRGLQQRIDDEGEKEGLKCEVQYWAGAWEIEEIFDKL